MKAILLAGGVGSRLFPATNNLSKQLLPIFDKPMFYYPLVTLMQAEIRDVLIITTPEDRFNFERMLGDGKQLGLNIHYEEQDKPNGIAKAFEIGADFINKEKVCLVLGDNLFLGGSMPSMLRNAKRFHGGATIFGRKVHDPERYGVVEFDKEQNAISIEEKPQSPKSNFAVTGLYFYDDDVIEIASEVRPSARGEYEITSVNQAYLAQKRLKVELLGDDVTWFDAGTHESYLEATNFVAKTQSQQKNIIGCPEVTAFQNGWISTDEFSALAASFPSNEYSDYLSRVLKGEISIL